MSMEGGGIGEFCWMELFNSIVFSGIELLRGM
jgi:hypothetical protein